MAERRISGLTACAARRGLTLWATLSALVACAGAPADARPDARADNRPSTARPAPALRTLHLALRFDERYALVAGAERRAREAVAAASRALAPVGLALTIDTAAPIATSADQPGALRQLDALERALAAEPVPADLVVLFAASPAPASVRSEHVAARYAGRAVFVRSMTLFFPPEETAGLVAAETRLLLQGIATIFGALPFCGDPLLAGPFPPTDALSRFDARNEALITAHRDLDFRGEAGPRVPAELARAAAAILADASPRERRCAAREFAERQAVLNSVLTPPPPPPPLPSAPPDEAPEAAWQRCEPSARQNPGTPATRCAGLAALATGRIPEALRHLRVWIADHPEDVEAVLALARTVGRSGDDGAARAMLAEYVASHPDAVAIWLNLGVAEARLGRLAAARAAWQRVLALQPDHADARALLAKLPPE
jgi:tetratricopeptide (TPR) repeat protein